MHLPYIPEDAPFNGEQRAWLAGFMAAMRLGSQQAAQAGSAGNRPALNILFGSQTGNAEALAMEAAAASRAQGLDPQVAALDDIGMEQLAGMVHVLIVTSTYGEGEMPDNAQLFWQALSASDAPRLETLHYAVLALGDTGYDGFCQAGKLLDTRLEQLGACRYAERVDCDVDYEERAASWLAEALPVLAAEAGATQGGKLDDGAIASSSTQGKPAWNRKNPYGSTLAVSRRLSAADSGKDIRHYEFALGDSGLSYEAGDALGVIPINDPAQVEALLAQTGANADTLATDGKRSLAQALQHDLEISTPSRELLAAVEQRASNDTLSHLLRHGDKEALASWLWGKDTLDLLRLLPTGAIDAGTLQTLLKPLQHRAYSISSSPLAHPDHIHLTVASVRYAGTDGRARGGVCSTFLADRLEQGGQAGIFVSANKSFRAPADNDAPMIMVGPGTGIAPFRAFLQERQGRGARGRNWLFFGDQRRATDFIYEEELANLNRQGVLHRLDLAFSRDQAEKCYVQTRMKENGQELYAWLQEGGHFYVCGDASRMAKDVDQALHDIIAAHGGLDADGAAEYVNTLKREKRYLRDVY